MKKVVVIIIFLIVYSSSIYSQKSKFEDAFIIVENGDTVFGKIQKKSNKLMSFQIDFVIDDSIRILKPDDIKSFCIISNNKVYSPISYLVSKSPKKFEKRFGRVLADGQVKLYKLNIPKEETDYSFESSINKVYVIQKDTSFYTLLQYEKLSNYGKDDLTFVWGKGYSFTSNYSTIKKEYLGVLNYVLHDCPEISEDIFNVGFYDKDMVAIIDKYNRCKLDYKPEKNYK